MSGIKLCTRAARESTSSLRESERQLSRNRAAWSRTRVTCPTRGTRMNHSPESWIVRVSLILCWETKLLVVLVLYSTIICSAATIAKISPLEIKWAGYLTVLPSKTLVSGSSETVVNSDVIQAIKTAMMIRPTWIHIIAKIRLRIDLGALSPYLIMKRNTGWWNASFEN